MVHVITRICQRPSRAKLHQKAGGAKKHHNPFNLLTNFFLLEHHNLLCTYFDEQNRHKMSLSSASGTMFKRTVFNPRLATAAQPLNTVSRSGSATIGSYRAVHHSARLPAITPSDTRYRPSLRPNHQPVAHTKVNGPSPTSKRTIFIQTESTPNPDVSDHSFLLYVRGIMKGCY